MNISLWLINTFETQKTSSNSVMISFYAKSGWTTMVHSTVPLCIFYRFHSSVCFAEIWKNTYKTKWSTIDSPAVSLHSRPFLSHINHQIRFCTCYVAITVSKTTWSYFILQCIEAHLNKQINHSNEQKKFEVWWFWKWVIFVIREGSDSHMLQ